ncbi:hypothetical protein [Streptomyces cirratus]|uniref:hypothetical protein n=1 Tax=Streptomyces cirratus TaxID=68187 RepID=UPI003616D0C1
MTTPRQAARQRRHRRRIMLGATPALTAAGALAYLVMAVPQDRKAFAKLADPGVGRTTSFPRTAAGAAARSRPVTPEHQVEAPAKVAQVGGGGNLAPGGGNWKH